MGNLGDFVSSFIGYQNSLFGRYGLIYDMNSSMISFSMNSMNSSMGMGMGCLMGVIVEC